MSLLTRALCLLVARFHLPRTLPHLPRLPWYGEYRIATAAADDAWQEGRDQLDLQWEQLKRQREEDEAFTRACKARSDDRWAQIAALRAECESMARAETRRKLYEDAERVWGPGWQSR